MMTTNLQNSNLEFFNYIINNEKKQIRYFSDLNNEIYFVAKDIAECLEYTNTQKAIRDHIDFKIKNKILETIDSRLILINESGLYSLILSSNMEKAKLFKKWVTKEVIPSIRKYGVYKIIKEKDDEINDLKQLLETTNARLQKIENQNNNLENKIDVMTEHMVDNSNKQNLKEQFLIVQILDKPIADKFQYHIIRAQKRNINRAIEDLRLKYNISNIVDKIIMRINYIPNSVMFKNKIRDTIEGVYIKSYLNRFNLINGHTIEELKNKIHDINNERFEA